MMMSGKKLRQSILQTVLSLGLLYLVYDLVNNSVLTSMLGNDGMFILSVIFGLTIVVSSLWTLFSSESTDSTNQQLIEILSETEQSVHSLQKASIRLKSQMSDENMAVNAVLSTLLADIKERIENLEHENSALLDQTTQAMTETESVTAKYKNLEQAPQQRSEFLSMMGDEITSPMKSLTTMLRLLNQAELDSESDHLLKIATHSAHSLTENITNILEFTKLDAGLLQLDSESFDLYESISQVLETQESIAISKSLLIEKHINPDVPQQITAPRKSIMKVMDNLISNAIRFTDSGSIDLKVDRFFEGDDTFVRFKITDTGVGIPEAALDTLFDSLDQDTHLKNSSFTGRLRLIVCKGLCELMGGKIGVTSKEGVGSEFWFTIRLS